MFNFFRKSASPIIKTRKEHIISRRDIDPDALRILYRLSTAGYEAYLVGGSVRDLLLKRTPKDFDIGTDAQPQEIKKLFRNCFLIGRRFRLAHIIFGKKVFETATFRKQPNPDAVQDENGLYQIEDNTYGSPEEDARRRDFTVNGLFYNIKDFSVVDYVDGLKDLEAKVIRCIGKPDIRFCEDPVRMMRAVRFAAKLGFTISSADIAAMRRHATALNNASPSRLCEEIQRLFVDGKAEISWRLAYEYGLMEILLPELAAVLKDKTTREATWAMLNQLDALPEPPPQSVRFAALYFEMFRLGYQASTSQTRFERRRVAQETLGGVGHRYKLPRAISMTAVDLLEFLPRFAEEPNVKRVRTTHFVAHGVFHEAFLFAQIVAKAHPEFSLRITEWAAVVKELGAEENLAGNPHRRSRRRRPRKPRGPRAPQGPVSGTAVEGSCTACVASDRVESAQS